MPASVLWFTGLPAAGKSTLAVAVCDALATHGLRIERLDGDAVRVLAPTGFGRADRDAHVTRVGFMASRLEHHGITVVCALISPYQEARQRVRAMCRRFIEIYVATPLEECERRDPKGLYARARRGEITNLTGVNDPYEPPQQPELVLDTSKLSVDEAVALVLQAWEQVTSRAPTWEEPLTPPAPEESLSASSRR